MNLSSHDSDRDLLVSLLGRPVEQLVPLTGGGNNRAYKVLSPSAAPVVAKFYFRSPTDPRDRLKAEYSASSFLWEYGVTTIPQPLCSDSKAGVGVYSFIEGERALTDGISEGDVKSAAAFTKVLHEKSKIPAARELGEASEACFSPSALLHNLEKRLAILRAVEVDDSPVYGRFSELREQLREMLRAAATGLCGNDKLPEEQRTLSPSDFGFHNAIRSSRGLVFHDFEYFGWDDPVKLISDFVLHPGMQLSRPLQRLFLDDVVPYFAAQEPAGSLVGRFASLFPLFQLKWCCIVLNEFVPEFRARRQFARSSDPAELHEILEGQMRKAERILQARVPQEGEKAPLTEGNVKV